MKRRTAEDVKRQYPKGCPRPSGYAAFFDWADAQVAHGLQQKKCAKCFQYVFPQESCRCVKGEAQS